MTITLLLAAALLGASGAATAQSRSSTDAPPPLPPRIATQPPVAAADMQAVLDQLARLGSKPIETLTPAEARIQASAADAVRAVMRRKGLPTAPDPAVTTRDLPYGSDPMHYARIYTPVAATGASMPVIVYYHGGGWVLADVTAYDALPRLFSRQLNAIVVSVEYRHAPEFKFPAQHDDAFAAYRWVLRNAASWGGDTARLALAGEGAGGNLAIATAIRARDDGLTRPVHVLAVDPIANSSMALPSRMDAANARPLNGAMLNWFAYYETNRTADLQDSRLNLVGADLHGLPPTTIVNAQIDPLRSDGETLAAAMKAAGDTVEQRTFPGVTHAMFGMGAIVRGAYDADRYAIARLRRALGIAD
ncbi:alpha/beta hydrolase [Sphingomonas sp. CROZ-RG-20F-R02-07]|uniref:alpha/beta hydrolase n=1 Tax=Sphingomonas sp. CROZ-RG-20F-R02-07 TaxID=2914832 RepID=UPI001F564B2A|nr:alpha/beta hydrolase [Sphingomonas sp. CROZ-RG-20F-R02-07]